MNTAEQKIIPNEDIFERMRSGEPIRLDDVQYSKIHAVIQQSK